MSRGYYLLILCGLMIGRIVNCSHFGWSGGWTPSNFPNPMVDPLKCGRKNVPRSQVCDPDAFLSKDLQDEVEGHINFIKSGQAAVAIVKRMDLTEFSGNVDRGAESFCRTLHDQWGVGSAEKNDGVVIFLSVEDRAVFISTGDGVKDRISRRAIESIIGRMKPFLRKKDYGGALVNAIIEVEMGLNGKEIPIDHSIHKTSYSSSDEGPLGWIMYVIAFCGVFGYAFYQNRKLRHLERGRIALDSLIREVDNTTNTEGREGERVFATQSCPICLENFTESENKQETEKSLCTMEAGGSETTANTGNNTEEVPTSDDEDKTNLLRNLGPNPSAPVFTARTVSSPTPVVSSTPALKPMALRCGHTFCHDCITTHLRSDAGRKCPICRLPVHEDYDGMDPPRPRVNQDPFRSEDTTSGSSSSGSYYGSPSTSSSTNHNRSFHSRRPELIYRLNRMRYLYPDIMTVQLLNNMNRAVDRGELQDIRRELSARSVEIQRTVTEMREASQRAARSSGSGGASRGSFGGGRSSGGGGGRW